MKKLCIFTLLVISLKSYSQFEQKYWIFGQTNSAHIEFSYAGPINTWARKFTTNPLPPPGSVSLGYEGTAVATDPNTGNLLFYTDGESVYDSNHNLVVSGLGASNSSAQPVALCLIPTCPLDSIYIFSNPTGKGQNTQIYGPITYRKYHIPSGTVTTSSTLLPGPYGNSNVGEGMIIVQNSINPLAYWLITGIANTNSYVIYTIDSFGIAFHKVFEFGPTIGDIMNIAYNKVRKEVGFARYGNGDNVFTCNFDPAIGEFDTTSYLSIRSGYATYDLEYSPSGIKLYYASYHPLPVLWQYDFANGQTTQIYSSTSNAAGGLKLGADGYVYHISNTDFDGVSSSPTTIGRIETPDLSANDTNFIYNPFILTYTTTGRAYNFPEFLILPSLKASVTTFGPNPLCFGDTVTITSTVDSLGLDITNYQWFFEGNPISDATTPTLILTDTISGTYWLQVDFGDCSIISNTVSIEFKSLPVFDLGDGAAICEGDSLVINAPVINGATYIWQDGSGSNVIIVSDSGNYSLEIVDSNGCKSADEVTVTLLSEDSCEEFEIHDVLTPNGDGVNEYWEIDGIANYPENEIVIYNRWGNIVFETTSYNNTWNGRNDAGEFLPSATYYYVIKLHDVANRKFAGDVTIIR